MKLFASIAAFVGALVAATATTGCFHLALDEPQMPESLL